MNVLDLAEKHGHYKRVSSNKGGEYHGPCPMCGGNDRFHIWPAQKGTGDWWCRGCDKGGDLIQWYIDVEGMTFPEACKAVGRELPEQQDGRTPQAKRPAGDNWQPSAPAAPVDLWREHAEKFVEMTHQQLLSLGDAPGTPLAYLAERGINQESAIAHRLGWNGGDKGKDLYRVREAWGLETVLKANDGKAKKLWLPIGLVIPYYVAGQLHRVRIRIPNERRTPELKTPYYVVPGSSADTFVINHEARAYVIVEAELDGILVAQETAGLDVGAMALGNNSAKPTDDAYALLNDALHISVALDYDLEPGSTENPGGKSSTWWSNRFPQAERWPVPAGKDPGDAFKAGFSIRQWVLDGLPPIFKLSAPRPAAVPRQAAPVVTFDADRMQQLISDTFSRVFSECPSGASWWLETHRSDIAERLLAIGKEVDSAFEAENEAEILSKLATWEKYHLRAWQRYHERPEVIERQTELFEQSTTLAKPE